MNNGSTQLYTQMQEDINGLLMHCKCETSMIEGCFNIVIRYWSKIKKCLETHLFSNETEEIYFFKNIKPLFTGAIEYYTLHYQAILFKPSNDTNALVAYWMHELKRVEKFYARHKEFYQYYSSGQCHMDDIYFTRASNTSKEFCNKRTDVNTTTSHDHIVACIIAYQKYYKYVEAELEILLQSNTKEYQQQYYPCTIFFTLSSHRFSFFHKLMNPQPKLLLHAR
ncbi:RteC domain-containing protein [Ferruginibacter sp. SUN106]|uniref:RteC domain-containing protein n=1 Tax=Ferruginibacter sp. SUN106 TaxID=2978348 RepID=UPI003D366A3C